MHGRHCNGAILVEEDTVQMDGAPVPMVPIFSRSDGKQCSIHIESRNNSHRNRHVDAYSTASQYHLCCLDNHWNVHCGRNNLPSLDPRIAE